MKKSQRACKPGKAPVGKNGRCVKTNRCKPGKAPVGKNGRCVKPKTLKVRKSRKQTPSPVKIASPVNTVSPSRSLSPAALRTDEITMIIEQYMEDMNDPLFFSNEEIEKFVDISIQKKLDRAAIITALDQYSKDYGEFA
jgi:hypothetical protein